MTTANDVLSLAAADLGLVESPPNTNQTKHTRWYGLTGPWCAMAVSYWFAHAGLPLPASTSKGFAYTPSGAAWFQNQGRWSRTPQRGHVVFYDFPGDGVNRISHVGVVESVNPDGSIVAIEGNTSAGSGGSQRDGGGVFRRTRRSGIVGYGVPAFDAPTSVPTPQPPPAQADAVFRVRQFQSLVGVRQDGDFGPLTAAAANRNFIGWQEEVRRRGSRAEMVGNRNAALVRWLKDQFNRKYNAGLDPNSPAVGPAMNHHIVVNLGQADGICGANGFRAACQ